MNWRVSLDPREGGRLSNSNLVQQGAELAYLLRHDPEFRGVRKEHLKEAGKRVRLKNNVDLLAKFLPLSVFQPAIWQSCGTAGTGNQAADDARSYDLHGRRQFGVRDAACEQSRGLHHRRFGGKVSWPHRQTDRPVRHSA